MAARGSQVGFQSFQDRQIQLFQPDMMTPAAQPFGVAAALKGFPFFCQSECASAVAASDQSMEHINR